MAKMGWRVSDRLSVGHLFQGPPVLRVDLSAINLTEQHMIEQNNYNNTPAIQALPYINSEQLFAQMLHRKLGRLVSGLGYRVEIHCLQGSGARSVCLRMKLLIELLGLRQSWTLTHVQGLHPPRA